MIVPDGDTLQQRLTAVNRELDALLHNGRLLTRTMIVNAAYRAGYVDGHREGAEQVAREDVANMRALMRHSTEGDA